MIETLSLLDWTPKGQTIVPERDTSRLGDQMQRVWRVMSDGHWHFLREISSSTGCPEASISARLRDLRNQFGKTIEREYRGAGLHAYRMLP